MKTLSSLTIKLPNSNNLKLSGKGKMNFLSKMYGINSLQQKTLMLSLKYLIRRVLKCYLLLSFKVMEAIA